MTRQDCEKMAAELNKRFGTDSYSVVRKSGSKKEWLVFSKERYEPLDYVDLMLIGALTNRC